MARSELNTGTEIMIYARPGQLLSEHLNGTATKTSLRLPAVLKGLGHGTGLWHDLGKFNPNWQSYLAGQGPKVGHAQAGAYLALKHLGEQSANCVAGHHGGLYDQADLKPKLKQFQAEIMATIAATPEDLMLPLTVDAPGILQTYGAQPIEEMVMTRMLFGALIDADRCDVAISEGKQVDVSHEALAVLGQRVAAQVDRFGQATDELNRSRRQFYQACRDFAKTKIVGGALLEFAGPTGIGKNLSGAQLALDIAVESGKKRVVYVAPFCSILEQNADVLRSILGDQNVLEHHSSFDPSKAEFDHKLAGQRWQHPFICTTAVQFLESLFSHRPRQCRKLPSLIDSVIVLDEAHTLPTEWLLRVLAERWGCVVILGSATQPDYRGFLPEIQPVIADPQPYFAVCDRVTYVDAGRLTWADIASRNHHQALIVCNTIAAAVDVAVAIPGAIRLTSLVPPIERRRLIALIQAKLQADESVVLCSTSLVEAGVNLDFPVGYRELTGIESLVQTAGRVNREGRKEKGAAVLNIFETVKDYHLAADVRLRADLARQRLAEGIKLGDADMLKLYSQRLWRDVDTCPQDVERHVAMRAYRSLSEMFRLIGDQVSVVVRVPGHERVVQRAIDNLDWAVLQQYTIGLSMKRFGKNQQYIEECNGINVWTGEYDQGICANL
jgi:CRISPR-associated endonuclease/helicase Cas3